MHRSAPPQDDCEAAFWLTRRPKRPKTTPRSGAWGEGVFENDDALDWLRDLADVQMLDAALGPSEGDYIEVDTGSAALAAAEVVASIHGHPAAGSPERVEDIVRARRWKPSSARAGACAS